MRDNRTATVATLCAWCGEALALGRLPERLGAVGLASHGLCRDCGADLFVSLEALVASVSLEALVASVSLEALVASAWDVGGEAVRPDGGSLATSRSSRRPARRGDPRAAAAPRARRQDRTS